MRHERLTVNCCFLQLYATDFSALMAIIFAGISCMGWTSFQWLELSNTKTCWTFVFSVHLLYIIIGLRLKKEISIPTHKTSFQDFPIRNFFLNCFSKLRGQQQQSFTKKKKKKKREKGVATKS